MKSLLSILLFMIELCVIVSGQETQSRSSIKCTEDSPERRGEEGCTVLANRTVAGTLPRTAYWHIDRFNSLEAAKRAAGPNGVAAEAHGRVWLMTVEGKTRNHHGGHHVALIGPLVLPIAEGYTMRVASSLLKQGASTPVHIHSGLEVWYIVSGEQCLETQRSAHRLKAGKFFILPTDQIHRGRVQSVEMRGALALVLYDSKRPASRDLTDSPPLVPCSRQAEALTTLSTTESYSLDTAKWSEPYKGSEGFPKGAQRASLGVDVKTGGETYYARFPSDTKFALHWHEHAEYAVVLRGTVTHILGQERRVMSPGDYIVIPPKTNHGWEAGPSGDVYLLIRRDGPADFNFVGPQK